ncbi:hypothetical protein BDQ17DRAFT_982864 [Cyathus striatus]|nr:hypothetical protein BDQ17DRAFT_982864 [Cyathus striatus]
MDTASGPIMFVPTGVSPQEESTTGASAQLHQPGGSASPSPVESTIPSSILLDEPSGHSQQPDAGSIITNPIIEEPRASDIQVTGLSGPVKADSPFINPLARVPVSESSESESESPVSELPVIPANFKTEPSYVFTVDGASPRNTMQNLPGNSGYDIHGNRDRYINPGPQPAVATFVPGVRMGSDNTNWPGFLNLSGQDNRSGYMSGVVNTLPNPPVSDNRFNPSNQNDRHTPRYLNNEQTSEVETMSIPYHLAGPQVGMI